MRRRNTTTEFLKECMADALIKLLENKPLDEITVSEITETADVARVTYYRHFNSKEELLYFKCSLIGDRWYNDLSAEQTADNVFLTTSFFRLMAENQDLLFTLYHANLYHIALLSLYNSIRGDEEHLPDDETYSAAFLSFGMFGILTEWVRNDFNKSPEELTALTFQNVAF